MNEKCITCGSCGMPLLKAEDHAFGDENAAQCIHCIKADGTPLTYEEILRGTVDYFKESQGLTERAALTMVKEILDGLPHWAHRKLMKCTPLSISINAPYEKAFAFISNPSNIPLYSGFVRRIFQEGGQWMGETSEGVVPHRFIVDASLGIFDCIVTEPDGFELHVYTRLLKNGPGCEYQHAVFQPPGISQETYLEWVNKTQMELEKIKQLIEKNKNDLNRALGA